MNVREALKQAQERSGSGATQAQAQSTQAQAQERVSAQATWSPKFTWPDARYWDGHPLRDLRMR